MIDLINSIGIYVAHIIGAICIFILIYGLSRAVYLLCAQLIHKKLRFDTIRLEFSLYLLLGLEFLVARDIITSIIHETWDELGKLAAIIALRIILSYFISKEVEKIEDHKEIQHLFLKRRK